MCPRLFAATLLLCLALPVIGCAVKAPPPPPGKAKILLPPAAQAKPGELEVPGSIANRPPPPSPPPPAKRRLPAPVESAPLAPPSAPATAAPATAAPPPPAAGRIVVGLLVPLSGPQAEIGKALLDAAQMALFDMGDEKFTLVPRDTGGTPDGAAKAANAVLDEGAKLILGPLLAAEVTAAAPIARRAGVPVVAFSSDTSVAGDGVFLLGLLPREQVIRVVGFAVAKGRTRFAALVPDNAYGTTVMDALEDAAGNSNGVVTQVERFTPGGDATEAVKRLANYGARHDALEAQMAGLSVKTDEVSRQALARLKEMDAVGAVSFDAVMIAEGGEKLRGVAPLLPYYDVDTRKVQVLGTALWNDPALGTEPTLVGGWFAAPEPVPRAEFAARFENVTGHRPHGLASLGYDAVALAAVLARGDQGPDFSVGALTADHGFAGVDGIFRFRPDGLSERGLAVLEMQRNEFKVLDPAPTAFTKLVN
jgi:branched-chain amino acid transport system substrate-binding protein